jgi:hypothetical protein
MAVIIESWGSSLRQERNRECVKLISKTLRALTWGRSNPGNASKGSRNEF